LNYHFSGSRKALGLKTKALIAVLTGGLVVIGFLFFSQGRYVEIHCPQSVAGAVGQTVSIVVELRNIGRENFLGKDKWNLGGKIIPAKGAGGPEIELPRTGIDLEAGKISQCTMPVPMPGIGEYQIMFDVLQEGGEPLSDKGSRPGVMALTVTAGAIQ
jgi:hypothetical protein